MNISLNKERLVHVLQYQMKLFTEDELVKKYDSYLETDIKTIDDLLTCRDFQEPLKTKKFLAEECIRLVIWNEKLALTPRANCAAGSTKSIITGFKPIFQQRAGHAL